LDSNPDVAKVTEGEEQTALHTAVRFGQPDCVLLILNAFPSLASQANAAGQTPLDMARDLLENSVAWHAYMHKENRRTGSNEDFEKIIAALEFEAI
jgi:ankyrin repeat protein